MNGDVVPWEAHAAFAAEQQDVEQVVALHDDVRNGKARLDYRAGLGLAGIEAPEEVLFTFPQSRRQQLGYSSKHVR